MFYKYAGMQVFSAVHLAVIKDHNICLIRMVVLASAGALMDVMVQEDATPGVRATQRRYTTENFLYNMSLDFDVIRHVVEATPTQCMGLASPCQGLLPPST